MLNFDHKARVFKNVEYQDEINNNGYVVLPFLNESEIAELTSLYKDQHPDGVSGFYTSTFSKDTDYRECVDKRIKEVMKNGLQNYFFDYQVHCGSFIVKGPDEKSALKMHQDMTLVDEDIYTGINIWIPLIDLNQENGALEVLPKSHRLFKTYRGASLPDIYDGIEADVYKVMKPVYLKAGEAIIFDQSIIHCSPPNRSAEPRPVINTFITHKDATIKICYWDGDTGKPEIEVFEQENDFMVNFQHFGHDIFSRPSVGKLIAVVPFNFPKITPQVLKTTYGYEFIAKQENTQSKKNIFQKLFGGK